MLGVCEAIVELAGAEEPGAEAASRDSSSSVDPLMVEVGGEQRPAWADVTLVGEVEVGDEVVVNTQARDLGLGSGGFDIVHVNLSRGLLGAGPRAST